MTEKEYNIEVLCTCYSLERLILQKKKIESAIIPTGCDVIDVVTPEELDLAISAYNEEKYKQVRDNMKKRSQKYKFLST